MSIKVFYCYAREDKALRETLEKHLGNLKRQELITGWSDRNIDAGKEWAKEIDSNLNTANIILLLISPDFMHSDYCYSHEMNHALKRHENGTARVIPIILRHVEYEGAPFSCLQALPTDAIPVTDHKWGSRDVAFSNVAQGIKIVVKELLSEQWLSEGNIHFYREQYEDALVAFERSLSFNSSNALAHIGQGETLWQLISQSDVLSLDDRNEKAFAAFERALSLGTTNARAYLGKGKVLYNLAMPFIKEAEKVKIFEALDQAIELDSKSSDAYIIKGDVFMDLNKYEDAAKTFKMAIEVATFFNRYAWNRKGQALYQCGDYEEAINTCNTVIQAIPEHPYAFELMGDSLFKLKRYQEALAAYEQALQLGNSFEQKEAYKGKGNVLQALAEQAFEKAGYEDPFLPDYPVEDDDDIIQ
jgi:tetratricopeptide (TPR) repeat protein